MCFSVQSSKYSESLLPLVVFNVQNTSISQKSILFQSKLVDCSLADYITDLLQQLNSSWHLAATIFVLRSGSLFKPIYADVIL